jgi:Ca2+-binding EF-hand superfamily protein
MAKAAPARSKKLTREDTSQVLKDDLVKDLASAFALFKGNSRDRLGREELRPILKQFNITGANVEEMIKSVNQFLSLFICFYLS